MNKVKLCTVLTKTLISIGIFFSLFSYASADYTVSQNMGSFYTITGWSSVSGASTTQSGHMGMVWTATATASQIDRIDIPLCTNTASPTGTLYLDVWSVSDTGNRQAIASSSLSASGNVWQPCGTPNATTTTFVFTPKIQVVAGVRIFFDFWSDSPNTYTWYVTHNQSSDNRAVYMPAGSTTPFTTTESLFGANARGLTYILRATGIPPVIYNASSSNVSCETFDFGCYFSQALNYAFYPDEATLDGFENLNFASSSPFGYITDMDSALQTFMTALNATSSSFKITLDMTTLDNTSSVFSGVSTSSIEVFNICWVNRAIGELPANSFSNKMLPMIVFMMWIGLGWLFYSVAHKIW